MAESMNGNGMHGMRVVNKRLHFVLRIWTSDNVSIEFVIANASDKQAFA